MGSTMTRTTTTTERARRVSVARHNGRMEGVEVTPAMRADAEAYISGALGVTELLARTRARYGLH
ncbi:antitoxin VbhA family protein [Corynebacterium humireducens]|nr:antitoxin VbhA family protein [Corynebacterium humireducens]